MSSTLYLFGAAAPPVFAIAGAVEAAQRSGWDVCLGLTPTAARWLSDSLEGLSVLTGHPVRWQYKAPGEPDVWPAADAVVFAPATFNTVNRWAQGITDTFAVGVVAEAIGKGLPLVAMPFVNEALARHPAFERSVGELRLAGVRVLYGEGGFEPHPTGTGTSDGYPWHLVLDALAAATQQRTP